MLIVTHCVSPLIKTVIPFSKGKRPLFHKIIYRKSAGPRKCLFNKTVSCRRERVVCVHEGESE